MASYRCASQAADCGPGTTLAAPRLGAWGTTVLVVLCVFPGLRGAIAASRQRPHGPQRPVRALTELLTGPGADGDGSLRMRICSCEHTPAGEKPAQATLAPLPEEPASGAGVGGRHPHAPFLLLHLGPWGHTQYLFFKKVGKSESRCLGRLSVASFPRALLGGHHHRGAPRLLPGRADAV